MTPKEYAWAAVDIVIELAAECGLKYRRGDFYVMGREVNWKDASGKNFVNFVGDKDNPSGISVVLRYDFERNGKKLKRGRDGFYSYLYCRVRDDAVYFNFSLNEIDIQTAKNQPADDAQMETVLRKIQKLLALADPSHNPSEEEAIAASMMAQKLLAKYNLDIAMVTGEEKKEDIEQVIADVGTGKKWKYTLASIVANSYCCKCYYKGSEMVVFYGYKSDVLIARRVFVYLFRVGNSLAAKYVKRLRERNGGPEYGVYNSFCRGFCDGVYSELQKNCRALMLVTPQEVTESFNVFSANFKTKDHSIDTTDWFAYREGEVEGRRALNGRYLEDGKAEQR